MIKKKLGNELWVRVNTQVKSHYVLPSLHLRARFHTSNALTFEKDTNHQKKKIPAKSQ